MKHGSENKPSSSEIGKVKLNSAGAKSTSPKILDSLKFELYFSFSFFFFFTIFHIFKGYCRVQLGLTRQSPMDLVKSSQLKGDQVCLSPIFKTSIRTSSATRRGKWFIGMLHLAH